MNTQRLTSTYYDLTHGWQGFVIIYVLNLVFPRWPKKRGPASPAQILFSSNKMALPSGEIATGVADRNEV